MSGWGPTSEHSKRQETGTDPGWIAALLDNHASWQEATTKSRFAGNTVIHCGLGHRPGHRPAHALGGRARHRRRYQQGTPGRLGGRNVGLEFVLDITPWRTAPASWTTSTSSTKWTTSSGPRLPVINVTALMCLTRAVLPLQRGLGLVYEAQFAAPVAEI